MSEIFFTYVEDADYGNYYQPTSWGFTVMALGMVLIFLIAIALTSGKGIRLKAKQLAFCSLAMALAYVASTFLKLWHMPMGGSVTLFSMLFITMIGYWYGLRTGLLVAVSYGMLQLVTGPYIISLPQLIIDYILSFGALGLSGIFKDKKYGLLLGYLVGVLGRFFFSFISGVAFFGSAASDYGISVPLYSFIYNGAYIGLEALITVVFISIPPVKKAFTYVKGQAA